MWHILTSYIKDIPVKSLENVCLYLKKKIVSNYLASFYSRNKFKVGDEITVNGVKGEIIELDNSTVILKTDKSKIILPLSKLSSEMVEIHYK